MYFFISEIGWMFRPHHHPTDFLLWKRRPRPRSSMLPAGRSAAPERLPPGLPTPAHGHPTTGFASNPIKKRIRILQLLQPKFLSVRKAPLPFLLHCFPLLPRDDTLMRIHHEVLIQRPLITRTFPGQKAHRVVFLKQ